MEGGSAGVRAGSRSARRCGLTELERPRDGRRRCPGTAGQAQAIFHLSTTESIDYKLIAANIENVFRRTSTRAARRQRAVVASSGRRRPAAPCSTGLHRGTSAAHGPLADARRRSSGHAYVNLHTNDGVARNTGRRLPGRRDPATSRLAASVAAAAAPYNPRVGDGTRSGHARPRLAAGLLLAGLAAGVTAPRVGAGASRRLVAGFRRAGSGCPARRRVIGAVSARHRAGALRRRRRHGVPRARVDRVALLALIPSSATCSPCSSRAASDARSPTRHAGLRTLAK